MTATVTLLTPPASPAEANARPAAACGPTWTVVASPSPGTIENYLYAVTAISATDAWAVGMYSSTGLQQTLIEHWDGTEWTKVSSPNASGHNALYGVAAVSTDDVWAVGTHRPDLGTFKTLAMHWNGVEWNIVKSPNAAGDSFLYAAAAAGKQVWAIGQSSDAEPFRTLAMRWTGSRWKIVPTPNPYVGSHYLLGAAAVPSGSPRAWAAGNAANAPLILEWNGREWTSATAPGTDEFDLLSDVEALSSGDVWAVGYSDLFRSKSLILHSDGQTWQLVDSPNSGNRRNELAAVAAVGTKDVWAVGLRRTGGEGAKALFLHWDGLAWTEAGGPTLPNLYAAAALSDGHVWAVGWRLRDGHNHTLVEHLCPAISSQSRSPG